MKTGVRYLEATQEQMNFFKPCMVEAINVLRESGIDVEPLKMYKIKINVRKSSVALCDCTHKVISIGKLYLDWCKQENEIEELTNTFIHEMLHVIGYVFYNCKGHTGWWKTTAQMISATTKYKVERTLDSEKSESYNKYITKDNTAQNKIKYICYCEKCNQVLKIYQKRSKYVENMLTGRKSIIHCKDGGTCNIRIEK